MLATFSAEIKDGKVRLRNRNAFDKHVSTLKGDVVVAVGKRRKKRSNPQNAWYWGCILKLMSETTGHTPEELHEAMKQRFNCKAISVGRQVVPVPGTTTGMSTMEFSDFIERVRAFAATELNIPIPDPQSFYEQDTS